MRSWIELLAALAVVALLVSFLAQRHARKLLLQRRLRINRFKLRSKHAEIEETVLESEDVRIAIEHHSKEHSIPLEDARELAKEYLQEILPKFNLLAYYRFGAPLARAILNFLYRVVVERKPLRDFNERAEKGSVVVYLINHRSNADYVLVAHMLFKFISLSYAVGEWARIWPLNHLFKWFGSYFIRRRFREPLYHAVLQKFVETITMRGVTQGVFLEGGLTRDGAFQKPKLGMLDYIVGSKRNPQFKTPLYLIPTAINYDRVLEDRTLTRELLGEDDRATKWEKLRETTEFLFKNVLRSVFRRFKRYGYAIVTFGEPIRVDDFIREHPDVLANDFEARRPSLTVLANRVMHEISTALPVTPVCVVATILKKRHALTEEAMIRAIGETIVAWKERLWLLREHDAESVWRAARNVLELRHLIELRDDEWRWADGEELLLNYYANAMVPFEDWTKEVRSA